MGAEQSRLSGSESSEGTGNGNLSASLDLSNINANGMRRSGSSSMLFDSQHAAKSLPTSSSATALSSMAMTPSDGNIANVNAASSGRSGSSKTDPSPHARAPGQTQAQRYSANSLSSASTKSPGPGAALAASLSMSRIFGSHRNTRNGDASGIALSASACTAPYGTSTEDPPLESMDLPIVEWEGYVTKRGHLVRNWKTRFFTLEGNSLSYYETKDDARNREHLKARVTIKSVRRDTTCRIGHGYDFSFETTEGKSFVCSVSTPLEQIAWVAFLEASVDYNAIQSNTQLVYQASHFDKQPDMHTNVAYDLYRRLICGELTLLTDFMAYLNKDIVITSLYPKISQFSGDFFGREGMLHLLAMLQTNVEVLEFTVQDITVEHKTRSEGRTLLIKGYEKLKSKHSAQVVSQPWTHRVTFGPYGRISKLRIEIDLKRTEGNWKTFNTKNPFSELADAGVRSTRSLSISLKDFTVYNVIGKGGFGTVVNAVKKSDGQIYALKILEKSNMTKYDIDSTFTEMRVAQSIHHPFVAGLRLAFQSRTKLFLGMNYYAGGDLFHHMSKGSTCRISSARAHFYAAELVLGIHHLHQNDVLYRDIKPENVMIDADGHIALVDFGLAKLNVSNFQGAKTMAGSPQYTAPELLLPKAKRSYGKAADWWSLGILMYEMNLGKSPFYDSNVEKMYRKIQQDPLRFPDKPAVSPELQDILVQLLRKDPMKRLGSNIADIVQHPYFHDIDWDLLLQKKVTPPWKPNLATPLDVEYVDTEFTEMDAHREVQSPTDKSSRSKGFLAMLSSRGNRRHTPPIQDPTFKDFTYYCENPDALVEVTHLANELRPQLSPSNAPGDSESSSSSEEVDKLSVPPPESETPLSSFVETGKLSSAALARSPEYMRKDLRQLEEELAKQFERLEVTISREKPAHLQKPEEGATRTEVTVHTMPITTPAPTMPAVPARPDDALPASTSTPRRDLP